MLKADDARACTVMLSGQMPMVYYSYLGIHAMLAKGFVLRSLGGQPGWIA